MRTAGVVALVLIASLAVGCRSHDRTDEFRDATGKISDQLVTQLERRIDVRHLRLLVEPFTTTGAPPGVEVRRGRVYYEDTSVDLALPQRFRNQLVSDLAQRVRIVEPGGATATALLVGTMDFVHRGHVVIRARILDAGTNEVLAVADEVLRR
jgi:hypothetical protein